MKRYCLVTITFCLFFIVTACGGVGINGGSAGDNDNSNSGGDNNSGGGNDDGDLGTGGGTVSALRIAERITLLEALDESLSFRSLR